MVLIIRKQNSCALGLLLLNFYSKPLVAHSDTPRTSSRNKKVALNPKQKALPLHQQSSPMSVFGCTNLFIEYFKLNTDEQCTIQKYYS